MLRITENITAEGRGVVLRLEGRVAGPWVAELRRALLARRGSPGQPVVLDLEQVSFIDHEGVAFFHEVATDVRVVNCSLFAAEQLKKVTACQQMVRR